MSLLTQIQALQQLAKQQATIETLKAQAEKLQADLSWVHDEFVGQLTAKDTEIASWIKRYEGLRADMKAKDAYIQKLEAAYLEIRHSWACSKFDNPDTLKQCDLHAQEALDKIREGN